MVCRVEYGEFTNQGRLKYATFVSLAGAKAPTECRTEDAHGWPVELPVGLTCMPCHRSKQCRRFAGAAIGERLQWPL